MKIRVTNKKGVTTVEKMSVSNYYVEMCKLKDGDSTVIEIEAPLTVTGHINRKLTESEAEDEK